MSDHAILSPSSADRWIHCPPSAKINAEAEREDTTYTREGTLAHKLAELKAYWHFLSGLGRRPYTLEHQLLEQDPLWQPEMDTYTDDYMDYLKELYDQFIEKPYVAVEQKVDLGATVPGVYGTCDCLMVGDLEPGKTLLQIIDFKYGKGVPVKAKDNPQMMLYALGALEAYDGIYDIGAVGMTIIQPRIRGEDDSWAISPKELRKWARDVVQPAATLATKGEGDFHSGEWCRWCSISGSCRARAAQNLDLRKFDFKGAPELTDEEVATALAIGSDLKSWLSDLEGYALRQCLDGKTIPGWKAVAGRSIRQWTDIHRVLQKAEYAGIDPKLVYESKPVSLAQMEKNLGKKKFQEVFGEYVTTPPGKPTLVPDTDKRQPLTHPTAQDDFM